MAFLDGDIHGVTCVKVQHVDTGYGHHPDDDGTYVFNNCVYCGRCHQSVSAPVRDVRDRLDLALDRLYVAMIKHNYLRDNTRGEIE